MYLSLGLLSTLLGLFETAELAAAASPSCKPTRIGNDVYDLTALTKPQGDWQTKDQEGRAFNLNICAPVNSETWTLPGERHEELEKNTGIYRSPLAGEVGGTSLGTFNDTLTMAGDTVTLVYKSGSPCPTDSKRDAASIIAFQCVHGPGLGQPVFVGSPDDCAYFFTWNTPAACPVRHSSGFWHAVLVFFSIVFIAVTAFLLGSILYKRLGQGQRGLDQLPSLGVVGEGLSFVKDMVVIVTLTAWDKVSGLVHRMTGRRGGGFRGLSQDESSRGFLDEEDED